MKQAKHNITIKQNTENKIVIGLDDCGLDAVITFNSKFNYKTSENITDVKCYLEPTNNEEN